MCSGLLLFASRFFTECVGTVLAEMTRRPAFVWIQGRSSRQLRAIAAKRYGATKSLDPSRYGGYNKFEYFSESYASMTGGRPNAHGKALKAWMK